MVVMPIAAKVMVPDSRRASLSRMTEPVFERFYASCASDLRAYLTGLCGSRTLAEDLFQRAFVRFLQAGSAPTASEEMRAYLFRIATNLVIDHWRSARNEQELPIDSALPIGPDASLRADVAKIFAKLEPRDRAMLWLAHVEGHDHREIAEMIGVGQASVKVLLFRARRKLSALLDRAGIGPEVLR